MQECVSEFIAFITSEAAERCAAEKRKTITGEDIVWAMEQLGFDQYAHLMKLYLHRYRDITKTSAESSAGAAKAASHQGTPQIGSRQTGSLFDQATTALMLNGNPQ